MFHRTYVITIFASISLLPSMHLMGAATAKPMPAIEITSMKDYKELCTQDKPFVLMFYAPWCGACSGMKEPFNEVATQVQDIILAKVNIDNTETKSLKEAFCVTAVPTFITRQTGAMSKDALASMVNGHRRLPIKPIPEPHVQPKK